MFILKRGSEGQEVKRMQGIIDATPDGDFGSKTETALKEYQTCHGLVQNRNGFKRISNLSWACG